MGEKSVKCTCTFCGAIHTLSADSAWYFNRQCPSCKTTGFLHKVDTENTVIEVPVHSNKLPITFTVNYNEQYTPEHCRKPRTRIATMQYNYEIPCVSLEKVTALFFVNYLPEYNGTYYLYKGNLYKLANTRDISAGGDYTQELTVKTFYCEVIWCSANRTYDTQKESKAQLNAYFDNWLIIDGRLYKRTSMPCYEIATFGLGGNHGGTGFMVSLLGRFDRRRKAINDWCFYPHDFAKAEKRAIEVAANRGDTESVEHFKQRRIQGVPIKILNMEVYKKYANVK